MRLIDWIVIAVLLAVVIRGTLDLSERPAEPPALVPDAVTRRPAPAMTAPMADQARGESFAAQVPPPPPGRVRETLVIEAGDEPRRGGLFSGTAWALTGAKAWLSARHVTDRCRSLGFDDRRLAAAAGHPTADVSAIPRSEAHTSGLVLSRDPLTVGEDVYLVGYPGGEPAAVHGTVVGAAKLDHRSVGVLEAVVVVNQRRRVPQIRGALGGISGGPVLDADGHVVGSVIGGMERRARSIISIERNIAWLAAVAGDATSASLATPEAARPLTPATFPRVAGDLLSSGQVRLVLCRT